jgi:diphthamide biosynthesis protein 3
VYAVLRYYLSRQATTTMSIYEEVEFEDLDYDPVTQTYTYPCPCGDKFSITLDALWDGEDIATCPSCTLRIEIIYDEEDLPPLREEDDDDDDDEEEEGEKKKQDEDKGEEKKEEVDHNNIANVLQKSLTVK